jgi:hypothetical protein
MFLVALGRKVDSVLEGKNMLAVVLHANDEPAILLCLVVECLGEGADLSIVLARGVSMLISRRRAGRSWRDAQCCRPWVFEYLSRAAEWRVSLSPPGGFRFVRRLTICCGIAASAFLAASPACSVLQRWIYNYRFAIASFTLRRFANRSVERHASIRCIRLDAPGRSGILQY